MKRKLIRSVNRSKMSVAFYYFQLLIASPILIPLAIIGLMADSILDGWGRYKNWYLKKTLRS